MQLLTHAPTGPWPELGTCPCCGGPWGPHPFLPPPPFEPWDFPEFPEPASYEPTPSPFVIEEEPEEPTLAVSGVSLRFLLFLVGDEDTVVAKIEKALRP